jgi:hypothetical protein
MKKLKFVIIAKEKALLSFETVQVKFSERKPVPFVRVRAK